MYTGGAGGFDSRTPHFGLLAQLVERLVYTQLVVGSSPARSTGAWYGSALLSFVACCGVCYGVGASTACARAGGRAIMFS